MSLIYNPSTGPPEISGYKITSLGNLLLRQISKDQISKDQ